MHVWGVVALVLGSAALGLIGQLLFRGARLPVEWIVTGIGAVVGGYAASELVGSAGQWGPEFHGLFVIPALVGGIVLSGAVWLVARNVPPAPAGRAT